MRLSTALISPVYILKINTLLIEISTKGKMMKLLKLVTGITLFFSLIALTTMTQAQSTLLEAITSKQKSTTDRSSKVDLTQELQKYIPPGCSVQAAREVLMASGFAVTTNVAHGDTYISGSKELHRSILGYEEARITLKVANEIVMTSTGSIFRHAL
ncbi:hypothetical protein [Rhodoferax aquaticus]|uniref:Uncharacterized protein n=1 Tax=Rhodoferax aquaticus TaxID=2527691 RepID=A0A515EU21_9BURK|nr:hypothetical protein [Rhodoferax aquaticus]QDL56149.1 hypothetical protein EXZ61_19390 [Rhodoferax aquaticus]